MKCKVRKNKDEEGDECKAAPPSISSLRHFALLHQGVLQSLEFVLRWWKWHPDHFYIQAMVSIRTSQFWSDRWHFFLFNQPKIFWNLREYASYLFQVGIFRSDPFVSPSTHQFEFISTFAPFPILPRRPIYFSSNNHQTSSHKSYLPTTPIIANWRRSGARKSVDAAPNHGCEKIRRRNKYDRKFVTNPLWPVPMDPWGLGVIK